jgi:hypothetical protein
MLAACAPGSLRDSTSEMLRHRIEDGSACLAVSLRVRYDIREPKDRVYEYEILQSGLPYRWEY